MIVYKDILTGDELFTDVYPIEPFMEVFYKVKGKTVTENSGDIDESLIGGNKSAEDVVQDEIESTSKQGCNIVLANNLVQAPPFDKKSLMAYIKTFAKTVVKKLDTDEEKKEFQEKIPAAVKYLVKELKEFDFYTGESMNPDGSMGYLNYEEDGITPYMLFFKHALVEEKL